MTILITGASRGIGFHTAWALAGKPSRSLVLAGKNLPRLQDAAQRIERTTGHPHLIPMKVDLGDLAAVRDFTAAFRERDLPPLKAIICNAGVSVPSVKARSTEGYELMFAVNHLGHFLLVNLLLDALQPPARILMVSSGTHDPAKAKGPMQPPRYVRAEWLAFPARDPGLPDDDRFAGGQAYATSKLCNILFAYELDRRLKAAGWSAPDNPISVNAFAPGLVAGTALGRNDRFYMRFVWNWIMPIMSRRLEGARTPQEAGEALAYLAVDPALKAVSGAFFDGRERVESSAESHDRAKAVDLWETSIALSGLLPDESPLA